MWYTLVLVVLPGIFYNILLKKMSFYLGIFKRIALISFR